MSDSFKVQNEAELLDFLFAHLKGWSRNNVKLRLQKGCVSVNGKRKTRHNYGLVPGDKVEVSAPAKVLVNAPVRLEILYEDRHLVAINKTAGMLSVASATETHEHAMAMLRHQLARGSRPVRLWPVHRLDRDTSGVLLFAKSREKREAVMDMWDDAEKTYLAVVEGIPSPATGSIDQPLRLDEVIYRVHVGPHPKARPALTHYKTLRSTRGRSLLEVKLVTGRQHQIRAHLAWLGYPVVGDSRYGTVGNRMGLHALSLTIIHPDTGKALAFSTPAPPDFMALMKP